MKTGAKFTVFMLTHMKTPHKNVYYIQSNDIGKEREQDNVVGVNKA